jgi:RHS repeat-associated protein
VDDGGSWLNLEEYTPYGETSFGSFARKRYRFTCKERDEGSGLYYHGARYYAAWLGRWITADPLFLVDGVNLYIYVKSNPVQFIDSTGLEIDLDLTPHGGISQDEMNEYAAFLQQDIMALSGIQTTYDPATGVIQIADQTGDNIVDAADVQAVLNRVPQFEQAAQAPDRCGGNATCVAEATELFRELVVTLLPAGDQQSRPLTVLLTHYELPAQNPGAPNALGYAYFGQNEQNPHAMIDPRDYAHETEYRPRQGSQQGAQYLANPNIHRVMGPLFLLLHEREHNVRGTHDPDATNGLNGENVPGPNERRVNFLRQALGLPRRRAYIARPAPGGRTQTQFDAGWVHHPNFEAR